MTATPTIGQTSDGPIAKNVIEHMSYLYTKFHAFIKNAQFFHLSAPLYIQVGVESRE